MVTKEMSFQVSLENSQGVSTLDRGGKFIHQPGTVNEKVLESDFEPFFDGF